MNTNENKFVLLLQDKESSHFCKEILLETTDFMCIDFNNINQAYNFMKTNLPIECIYVISSHPVNNEHSGIDFILNLEELYKKHKRAIPFQSILISSPKHQSYLKNIKSKSLKTILYKPLKPSFSDCLSD